jgi:hypothetical protein
MEPNRAEALGGLGLVALALAWAYGAEASFAPQWILPLVFAHIAAGALIGKWRALLVPIAIIVVSIPAPTPPGADSTTFGRVFLFEVFIGFLTVAGGVLLGRDVRGKPLLRKPDPWR